MEKNLEYLIDIITKFCVERDWNQYHNPKDLAIGISTEANELLDCFRFKNEEQCKNLFNDTIKREKIEDEVADTLFFLLRFVHMNDIDIVKAVERKIVKNENKYPVEKACGKNEKYTEY